MTPVSPSVSHRATERRRTQFQAAIVVLLPPRYFRQCVLVSSISFLARRAHHKRATARLHLRHQYHPDYLRSYFAIKLLEVRHGSAPPNFTKERIYEMSVWACNLCRARNWRRNTLQSMQESSACGHTGGCPQLFLFFLLADILVNVSFEPPCD